MENSKNEPPGRKKNPEDIIILSDEFVTTQREAFFKIISLDYKTLNLLQKKYVDTLFCVNSSVSKRNIRSKASLVKCIKDPNFVNFKINLSQTREFKSFNQLFLGKDEDGKEYPNKTQEFEQWRVALLQDYFKPKNRFVSGKEFNWMPATSLAMAVISGVVIISANIKNGTTQPPTENLQMETVPNALPVKEK